MSSNFSVSALSRVFNDSSHDIRGNVIGLYILLIGLISWPGSLPLQDLPFSIPHYWALRCWHIHLACGILWMQIIFRPSTMSPGN